MGVPKFFRWINERYPCICEVVKEYQIPSFDNLYLDMNGIIHNCSHPNDDDPHFRISQEQIFQDIFHYIEFLFLTIKPSKVFFMAVDGVAPRAKMNQQRGRRFRSAKDAENLENNAKAKGEILPTEERFDSNCITPGTKFMADLNEQLKYFVSQKVSTDKLWQGVKVYLSGHETPGEGEHKIMDFIRHSRSQPDYDPNTTHCLYGLDADLLMLGLSSHEPHFSLLREEVKFFGKKAKVRKVVPEDITFFLLHLSLMRDYIEHEFSSLKSVLKDKFNLENIIDDWVLMGFLVGNDFIPNIPNFHIKHDALPLLYQAYMKVMSEFDGYMNEGGYLNLRNFEKFIQSLAYIDYDKFTDVYADLKYFEGKRLKNNKIKEEDDELFEQQMAKFCNISYSSEEDDSSDTAMEQEFAHYKKDYYMNKLEYDQVTPDVLRDQALGYIQAIQWNLHYYYNGIASWSWYFPHHYAPYISDIINFSDADLHYDIGRPFLPFQQLLGVLPSASRKLLPESYQQLMIANDSPMRHFYPDDFKTDLNGKTQEWEAVVLIPFIEETLLLTCTDKADQSLNVEEKQRNSHGPHYLYQYTPEDLGLYSSSLPDKLPDIQHNHAKLEVVDPDFFRLPREKIKKGLLPGVKLDVCYPGFPTLKHIQHKANFESKKVRVFEQLSQKPSMMIYIVVPTSDLDIQGLAEKLLGKITQVDWPFLKEGKVKSISTRKEEFSLNSQGQMARTEWQKNQQSTWAMKVKTLTEELMTRRGIAIGPTQVLLEVQYVDGLSYITQKNQLVVKKHWSSKTYFHPYQATVSDITVHSKEFSNVCLKEFLEKDSICFIQGGKFLGAQCTVVKIQEDSIAVLMMNPPDPNLSYFQSLSCSKSRLYMPANVLAQRLGISYKMVSRLTGTLNVTQRATIASFKPINIGLNLKFNKRNEEVPGYTKRQDDNWYYSEKVLKALQDYMEKFPALFENLAHHINQESIPEEEVFPEASMLSEIRKWIKEQPFYSAPHQTCNDKVIEEDVIQSLEDFTKKCMNIILKKNAKPQDVLIDPSLLFKPFETMVPNLPKMECDLFDRIVNVRESHCVPLGLRGTIIGIHYGPKEADTLYDVLFDSPFPNAMSIRGSSLCAYRVPLSSFIRLPESLQNVRPKYPEGSNRNSHYASSSPKKKVMPPRNNHFAPRFMDQSWKAAPPPTFPDNDFYPKFLEQKTDVPKILSQASPNYKLPTQKDYAKEWNKLARSPPKNEASNTDWRKPSPDPMVKHIMQRPKETPQKTEANTAVQQLVDLTIKKYQKAPKFITNEFGPTRLKSLLLEMPNGQRYYSECADSNEAYTDVALQAMEQLRDVMAHSSIATRGWQPPPPFQPRVQKPPVCRLPPPQMVHQIPESYVQHNPESSIQQRFVPHQVLSQAVKSTLNPNAKAFSDKPRKSRIAANFNKKLNQ
ncbi:XRN1 [Cordylochernes scorpioides]|uniref:5'-3' exoribonuclease 1 n=1 Tax=Cordylochernes scorpioides TaxID=51811 RepID=A0ABY6KE45_9ARAC|nr:XRN1 [Cordylochernes scorpioides]